MSQELPGIHWNAPDGLHIDVRGLPPPEPMIAILRQLEMPNQTGPVTVHHDREPIYLYPELAELGWQYELIQGDQSEVRLLLQKTA